MGQAMVFTATSVRCNRLSGKRPLPPGPDCREICAVSSQDSTRAAERWLRKLERYTPASALTPWELWFSRKERCLCFFCEMRTELDLAGLPSQPG